MNRSAALAAIALLVVLFAAVLRPRLSPRPVPLPPATQGVILLVVEGWEVFSSRSPVDTPNLERVTKEGAIGLVPTRSASRRDDDFAAGLQTLLAGSRSPETDAATLPDAARTAPQPFALRTFTGRNAVRELDAYLGTVLNAKHAANETLVIVGATPAPSALAKRERVAPLIVWQRGMTSRLLTSPSTRNRPGLCALTDVAATVAALLDLPPGKQRIGDGRPVETIPAPPASEEWLHRQAERWGTQAREQKLLPAVPWVLAGLVLAATFVRAPRVRNTLRTVACAVPLSLLCSSLFLVPFALAGWEIYAGTCFVIVVLGIVTWRSARAGEELPRYLALATALVIAGDALLGGPLLSRTPLSYSVLEAARFYGIGNEASGLFLGSALVAVGADAGVVATLFWGLAVAVVSGAPALGADAGGFIANLVAFSTLALLQHKGGNSNIKRFRKAITAAVGIGIVVAAFALWDGSRPPEIRTHVGQLVASVRERGFGAAQTIIDRKLRVNARLLVTSPWAILLASEVVACAVFWRKQKRQGAMVVPPAVRDKVPGVHTAIMVAAVTLFALNDSGVVAGATCGLWLLALRSDSRP